MTAGDVTAVETGACTDLHCVDTGMYDTDGFGSVYLLDAERPAVVETGLGANPDRILAGLERVGVDRREVAAIAVTHVHLDHAGGAGALAAACPNAEVVVHARGAPHLVDPSAIVAGTRQAVGELWPFYVEPEPVPEGRIRAVRDGDVVDLGDHALAVHAAPGHAPHQVVYHDPANRAVFTGDAAGIWIPRLERVRATTPPPAFDPEQALADVETVRGLEPTTLCYSHFGPHEDPARALDACEVSLREWVERVREARTELDDEAVVERFQTEVERELGGVFDDRLARGMAAVDTRGVLAALDGER